MGDRVDCTFSKVISLKCLSKRNASARVLLADHACLIHKEASMMWVVVWGGQGEREESEDGDGEREQASQALDFGLFSKKNEEILLNFEQRSDLIFTRLLWVLG